MTNFIGITTKYEKNIERIRILAKPITESVKLQKINKSNMLLLRLNKTANLNEILNKIKIIAGINDESLLLEAQYTEENTTISKIYYIQYSNKETNTSQFKIFKPYQIEIINERPLFIWKDTITKSKHPRRPLIDNAGVLLRSRQSGETKMFGFFVHTDGELFTSVCGKWPTEYGIFAEAKTIRQLIQIIKKKLADKGFEIEYFAHNNKKLQIKEMEEYLENNS